MPIVPKLWPILAAALLLASLLPFGVGEARAERRVALVVGNAAYAHAPALRNPGNDAADMAGKLEALGFAVTRAENLGQEALRRSLQDFRHRAAGAEVALLFFAGHGMEVDGRNWLLPVDARLQSDGDLEFEAIGLDLALRAVEGARRLRLVILDACRDNPFATAIERRGATRSIGRGLGRVEPPGNTLVAYAARDGTTASDGTGRNSPFTAALLAHLEEPGLEIGLLFRKVRDRVLVETADEQEPYVYGALSSESFYLVPPSPDLDAGAAGTSGPSTTGFDERAVELAFWESIKDSGRAAAFEAYLERYPAGSFAALARLRLEELAESQQATLPPATTAAAVTPFEVEAIEGRYRVSSSGWLNLRAGPGIDHDRVGTLASGTPVRVTGKLRGGDWYRVVTADGEVAFASGRFLQEEPAAPGVPASASPGETQVAVGLYPPAGSGESFRDCPECPEMVVIPAGSFTMGSSDEERSQAVAERGSTGIADYDDFLRRNETPQRLVTINYVLAVGKYPVTRRQWNACVESGGCNGYRPDYSWQGHSNAELTGREPVAGISWNDAQAYVRWLSDLTGRRYRLLSEAEWEYAARAGTTSARWWGMGINQDMANYGGYKITTVGSYPANPWGLYDMLGSVSELVEDCSGSYADAPEDGGASMGKSIWAHNGECVHRITRGGSWNSNKANIRSGRRGVALPDYRDEMLSIGFRISRMLD